VLATQTLTQRKAKNMRVTVDGKLPDGVTAKDIILRIIGEIGTAGGTGNVIEYCGEAIRALSMVRPHDRVQHVDRGGAPGRHGGGDGEDFCLSPGAARRRPRVRPGAGDEILRRPSSRTRAHTSTSDVSSTAPAAADRPWGHLA
jgi:hypothetical protein